MNDETDPRDDSGTSAVPPAERTGVVLAGGRSQRFEAGDKALAEVGGEPMLCRVVRSLGQAVDEVVVNCRADQRERFADALGCLDAPDKFVVDPVPDEGPLAGLRTALDAMTASWAVVVGCDMPGLDPAAVNILCERAAGADAAVPVHEGGRPQPTHAVYRIEETRAAATAALESGERSLRSVLERLTVSFVPAAEILERAGRGALTDVDTTDDLNAFERQR